MVWYLDHVVAPSLAHLLLVSPLLAVVLDVINQPMYNSLHSHKTVLQLLPCWRWSIYNGKD